jgi:chorismate mutase
MPTKSIDQRIADKLDAQKKLAEEIAQLKREQAQKVRSERQRVERQLGRLAVQCGLDAFTQEELRAVFQRLARELTQERQHGRHSGDRFDSDDDRVKSHIVPEL